MNKILSLLLVTSFLIACSNKDSQIVDIPTDGPIQLHPKNNHYFLYQGKALALITSAEHYGAVLNLDFDYKTYLKTLAEDGMNYTRIFTGTYFEIAGESFGIQKNTLAPSKDRLITPWGIVISDLSGNYKYDLSTWNEAYFERIKDFMSIANEHNIIVEVTLFSSIYQDKLWDICPQNPKNNINIKHEVMRSEAHTLNNGKLFTHQVKFVQKMVCELNEFDNFFFEIQNEPWADHSLPVYNIINKEEVNPKSWENRTDFANEESMAWQKELTAIIIEQEDSLPKKHLIAQNYANFKAPIPVVNKNISIINFHYAWPEAVEWNYHYNKVIGFDESGFAGKGNKVYRKQAWQFILSGGALFNNLDYSFFSGNENGLGENNAPGGGSDTLRQQLKFLKYFIHSFELERMYPNKSCIRSSAGLIPFVLSDKNNSYAVFLKAIGTKNTTLKLNTGKGNFKVQELNTITGEYSKPVIIKAEEGIIEIDIKIPEGELALKIDSI